MKVLVLGYGSIAQKHIEVLNKIDPEIELYALRSKRPSPKANNITNIYSLNEIKSDIDFFIISTPTNVHIKNLKELLPFKKPVLIEKPSVHELTKEITTLAKEYEDNGVKTLVGCNLRFHPCIVFLKKYLTDQQPRINEVNIYCGSYLPDWRPDKDFRKIYSSNKDQGGGVHLDLIHEIDYSLFLFGQPLNVTSKLRSTSSLKINSFDFAHYYFDYETYPLLITLNYFRHSPKREIEIIMDKDIWSVDLLKQSIIDENKKVIFKSAQEPLYTYEKQLRSFIKSIKDDLPSQNSLLDSLSVLKICLNK